MTASTRHLIGVTQLGGALAGFGSLLVTQKVAPAPGLGSAELAAVAFFATAAIGSALLLANRRGGIALSLIVQLLSTIAFISDDSVAFLLSGVGAYFDVGSAGVGVSAMIGGAAKLTALFGPRSQAMGLFANLSYVVRFVVPPDGALLQVNLISCLLAWRLWNALDQEAPIGLPEATG